MILNFASEIRSCLDLFSKPMAQKMPDNAELGSFHVVVLQRTAKKCTKMYNARTQPLFCSLTVLFGGVVVSVVVVICVPRELEGGLGCLFPHLGWLQPMLLLSERVRATAKRKWKYDYPHSPLCILGSLISWFMFSLSANASKNSKVVKDRRFFYTLDFIEKISVKKVALY